MSGYQLTYHVDMVFCIDATGSMRHVLDFVKQNALNFYSDIVETMKLKNKVIEQIRVRVIAFRDYLVDGENAMMTSDFFTLPEQAEDLKECLTYIKADGGGDIPEDGLEALAYAIRSPWVETGTKKRHIIALWTDAPAHPLGFGKASSEYPEKMAKDFEELSQWWGDLQHNGYMDQRAKRLTIFAPQYESDKDDTPTVWVKIANEWEQAMFSPVDVSKGLMDVGYETIIAQICNTI